MSLSHIDVCMREKLCRIIILKNHKIKRVHGQKFWENYISNEMLTSKKEDIKCLQILSDSKLKTQQLSPKLNFTKIGEL